MRAFWDCSDRSAGNWCWKKWTRLCISRHSIFSTRNIFSYSLLLRELRLECSLPDTRQLLWRSFGYLLSGATLMLGFLWSLWDEDRFTWQDRISQTYVTAATPVTEPSEFQVHPTQRHRFAHK